MLHFTYLFQIFWTFSNSFICAHSAEPPEISHFSRTFTQAPRLIFFRYFTHSWDNLYMWVASLFQTFQIFSPLFICAHPADALVVLHFSDIPQIPETCIAFVHMGGTCYLEHSAPNLFVHIPLILHKFHIFQGHLHKYQSCFFFWIFHTFWGHVLHLAYVFQKLQTFCTSPGHVLHVYISRWFIYFRHFRHLAPNLFSHLSSTLPCSTYSRWTPGSPGGFGGLQMESTRIPQK